MIFREIWKGVFGVFSGDWLYRPSDWYPLTGGDPCRGNPDEWGRVVADYEGRALAFDRMRQRMAAYTSLDAEGETFRKLELMCLQTSEYLGSMVQQYEQAAYVVRMWCHRLEDMQIRAGLAWRRADEAQQIIDDLQRKIAFYQEEIAASVDPDPVWLWMVGGPTGDRGLQEQVMEQRWVIEAAQREVDEIRLEYDWELGRIKAQYRFAPAQVLASQVTVTHAGVSQPINFLLASTEKEEKEHDKEGNEELEAFTQRMAEAYGMDAGTAEFLYPLVEQYGFDDETIFLVYRVKQGIDEHESFADLPQASREYLFLAVLGRAVYGGQGFDAARWDATSGPVPVPEQLPWELTTHDMGKVYQQLGLSEQEANKLIYHLNLQHSLAAGKENRSSEKLYEDRKENKQGEEKKNNYDDYKREAEAVYGPMSDDEFKKHWDDLLGSYSNRTDFAHQVITTATERNTQLGVVKELAGWRGDVTRDAEGAEPSMSNDDYRADLDAVNIDRRMDEDPSKSYLEVQAEYYRELREGKINRATEFKTHVDEDHVRQQVYQLSPYVERDGKYYRAEDATQAAVLGFVPPWVEEVPEEEVRDYVKKNYQDSYNFLRSIEEENNDLGSYTGSEDQ